ncbi:MAG: DUF2007 domain-containing protein [Gammaproteobacteria bacterium]
MKRVYTAESLIDGQLVVDLLARAGLPSILFNQNAGGGLGELPVTHPEVWLKRDLDHPRARRAIERFERSRPPPCDVTCAVCQESNPATFEICWQCNAPLTGAGVYSESR